MEETAPPLASDLPASEMAVQGEATATAPGGDAPETAGLPSPAVDAPAAAEPVPPSSGTPGPGEQGVQAPAAPSPSPAEDTQAEPAQPTTAEDAAAGPPEQPGEAATKGRLTTRTRGILVLTGMVGTAAILLVAALVVIAMYGLDGWPVSSGADLPPAEEDALAMETATPLQSIASAPPVIPTMADAPLPAATAQPTISRTQVASVPVAVDTPTRVPPTPTSTVPPPTATRPATPTPVPAPLTPGPAWQLRLGGAQLALTPVAAPSPTASSTAAPPAAVVPAAPPPAPPASTNGHATTHVVVAGENLTAIARRYNTTVDAIMAINNLDNENRIYAGMVLNIPGSP
ncbi:MAG: LysM peptidoglycan-binding domain-containing protein [Actinobacteria bacterium]|nr:LysM peptidoglycan-binding domain-containing protein [Actinomycetota bacterium]